MYIERLSLLSLQENTCTKKSDLLILCLKVTSLPTGGPPNTEQVLELEGYATHISLKGSSTKPRGLGLELRRYT